MKQCNLGVELAEAPASGKATNGAGVRGHARAGGAVRGVRAIAVGAMEFSGHETRLAPITDQKKVTVAMPATP
jgi:hypothetical protein